MTDALGHVRADILRVPGLLPPSLVPAGGVQPRTITPDGTVLPPQRQQGTPIIYPWWDKEMPNSVDWVIRNTGSTFTAANAAATAVTGFSFQVAPGNRGVVKSVRATVQSAVAAMQLTWTLLINGSPAPGWAGVSFPPGAAALIVLTWNDMKVVLEENQTLTAVFTETGATGPFACEFQAQGWQVSKATIDGFQVGIAY